MAQIPFKNTPYEKEIQSKLKETLDIYGKLIESNSSVQVDMSFIEISFHLNIWKNSKQLQNDFITKM